MSLVIALLVTNACSAALAVEIEIRLDKETYLLDEPIWLDVVVTGDRDDTEVVPGPHPVTGEFRIVVVRNMVDTLPAVGARGEFARRPEVTLDPGDTAFSTINLLDEFGKAETIAHLPSLETGSYTVWARYPGRARSNALSFKVEAPKGEEAVAHSVYISAILQRNPKPESAVDLAKSLIADHPRSVYAPAACNLIRQVYAIFSTDHKRAEDWAVYTLMHYPESGFAIQLQTFLISKYGRQEAARIRDSIVEKHPDNLRFRLGTRALRR